MSAIESEVAEINIEVNTGQGDRRSVRYRIHQLEQYNAAAKAAEAARDALKSAQAAKASARERSFTVWIAAINLLLVIVGVIASYILR